MSSGGKHILLIDDDPDMHEAIKLTLESEGYRVTCCLTGPEGMEALRRIKPDLVLLDIMLASPSEGFHLAYEIKKEPALKGIPIIMISAIGKKMGIDYSKEVGSDYIQAEIFLEKPFEAHTLRQAVQRLLPDKE
jgi:CheY-like chemotaxis protein